MNDRVRKSLPTKLAAIGFIIMILMGNYWFVLVLTQQEFPQWLMNSFLLNALFLIGCAVGVAYVTWRESGPQPDGEENGE